MKTFFCSLVALITLFAQIPAEDMHKYLSNTRILVQQGIYKEALERYIWFHDHALEHQPSMYGVRLSFALSDWKALGDKYSPAKKAFIETRDHKTQRIKQGTGNAELFHDVASFNDALQEDDKTIMLFEFLDKKNPFLAKKCWNVAKDNVLSARRFDLARKYLDNLIREFILIKGFFDQNVALYDDPRIGGKDFKAYSEDTFVKDSLSLIQVAVAWGDLDSAKEIQKRALACIHDERLENAVNKNEINSANAVRSWDSPQANEKVILFSLEINLDSEALIDPIALIKSGRPEKVFDISNDERKNEEIIKNFNADFYRKGREYFWLQGGNKKEALHVIGPKETSGCFSYTAAVEIGSTKTGLNKYRGLASNKSDFIDTKFKPRIPSTNDKNVALSIAKQYYSVNKKVPDELINQFETLGISIFDNGNRSELLIGSFDILSDQKSGNYLAENHKSFFYIIEYDNDIIMSKFAWYNDGSDADVAHQELIDIIDLDADGFPEIITKCFYYESWAYMIYKKQDKKWIEIFKGSGGGC